jgi:hypothetical protein
MFSRNLTRSIATGVAAIAIAIGAFAIANPDLSNGATSNVPATSPTSPASAPTAPGASTAPADAGQNQRIAGQIPQGWQSGSGTIITGAAADQATAVAVAAYPGGTVNRVLQLADGSYAVHQINIDWPHHVFVSTDFQVTGAIG